jgi:putative MATE family efflux protein
VTAEPAVPVPHRPGTAREAPDRADRTDLTRGPVLRRTVSYALPAAGSSLLQQSYLLVDGAVVGHYLGGPGLAAVGAAQGLVYLLSTGSYGLAGAFSIRIGQLTGAGQDSRAALRALAAGTVLWSLVGFGLTLALPGPAFAAMGVDAQVAQDARLFLTTYAAGLLAVFGLTATAAVYGGRGDSRASMLLLGLGNMLNAGLVWWFVGPLELGLTGAACATVGASALAAGVGLFGLARQRSGMPGTAPTAAAVRRELRTGIRIGLPITAQHLVIGLGATVLLGIVAGLGTAVLAGITVIVRLELFASLVFLALASALSVTVAQNTGAGHPDRIRTALAGCVRLTVALSVPVSIGLVAARDLVAGLFVSDPVVTGVIGRYIAITYPFFVCYALMVVIHGYVTGLGRTTIPLVCTLLSFAAVRLPLSALLGDRFGVDGLIWAVVVGWVVGLVYTVLAVTGARRVGVTPARWP